MVPMPRSEVRDTARVLGAHFGRGTFTTAQAHDAGVPAHRVASAVRAGAVLRMWRGHYRVAGAADPRAEAPASASVDADVGSRVGAQEPSARPVIPGLSPLETERVLDSIAGLPGVPAALGHASAARAWGLPTWRVPSPSAPVIVIPRGADVRPGRRHGVRFVVKDVDPRRVVMAPGGVPVTDPLLTAIHVAEPPAQCLGARLVVLHGGIRRQTELHAALASPASALYAAAQERLDTRELARLMADPDVRRSLVDEAIQVASTADIRSAQRVIETLNVSDPRVETALESLSWAAFLDAGMDMPTPQALVRGHSGALWRVDFLFAGVVVGECDGAVKYHEGQSLWREKKRQLDLENAGYIVVRWTWEEIVYQPHVVLARIALAVSRAARLTP